MSVLNVLNHLSVLKVYDIIQDSDSFICYNHSQTMNQEKEVKSQILQVESMSRSNAPKKNVKLCLSLKEVESNKILPKKRQN